MRLTSNDRLTRGLEQVERALQENRSKQNRFQQEVNPESLFNSVIKWVREADDEEPPYLPDSRARDCWLSRFWKREPHLAGVIGSVNSIDSNRGWRMVGGRNQVNRFSRILRDAEDGEGWRQYISLQSTSYYTADIGAITEVGRDSQSGPMRSIYHVDPTICRLTGKRESPLQYNNHKEYWRYDDFFRLTSLRNVRDEYRGLGFCAVSRVLDMARLMLAVYSHELEKLAVRAPKGLLLLSNISQNQWNEAMKARDAAMDSDLRKYYNAVAVIAQEGADNVDAKLVALSELPEGFDLEVFTNLLMYTYALCLGYDPIEFWPVLAGQLGRGRETDIQHRKGTGKGGLNFMLSYQDRMKNELPESLLFEFEQRDAEGVLLEANVTQAWANVANTLYDRGEGLLTKEQAMSLLVEQSVIPASWTSEEENAKATDIADPEATSRILKQRLLEDESVVRAISKFPNEPIVQYVWPENRQRILWSSGREALSREKFGIQVSKPRSLTDFKSGKSDFAIFQGDSLPLAITVRDRSGSLVDLSRSLDVSYSILDEDGTAVVRKSMSRGISVSGSEVKISLDKEDSTQLSGDYDHRLLVTDSTGKSFTVLKGRVRVLERENLETGY